MQLRDLELINFRNYSKKKLLFSPDTTIIFGSNGSGKTNILEAIFLLSNGKSFKADKDVEMIRFGTEMGRIKGGLEKQLGEDVDLEVFVTKGEVKGIKTPAKKYLINGVGKKKTNFVGNLKTVLFWPEDLELVTDSPTLRRKYLNFVLAQVDNEYRRCLISYEKGLRRRNRVLEAIREKGMSGKQLLFWNSLLIKNGSYLTRKREEYIDFINQTQGFDNVKKYQLTYDRSEISEQRLEKYKMQEIAAGVTLVGPHRDEMKFKVQSSEFKVNEYKDLSQYGSRGEQRLAVLWLKLGELVFVKSVTGEKPVLLLDDILSEFDHKHRDMVFQVICEQQTILTLADEHFIERKKLGKFEAIKLK